MIDWEKNSPTTRVICSFSTEEALIIKCARVLLVVVIVELTSLSVWGSSIYIETPQITYPYVAGVIKPEVLNEALDLVNSIRRIAGLPDDVVLFDDYNRKAQHASVLMDINKELSHNPPRHAGVPQEFYDLGYEGASNSNISVSYMRKGAGPIIGDNTLNKATMSYMDDSDEMNINRLGHRRWLLNPGMRRIGFGLSQSGGYSAMYVADDSRIVEFSYDFIAWPAVSEHPLNFFDKTHAWSVSPNPNRYDNSSITRVLVRLVRESDQRTWLFSSTNTGNGYFNVDARGFGTPFCIIFRPDGVNYENNDVFNVEISGLKDISGKSTVIKYATKFRDSNSSFQY